MPTPHDIFATTRWTLVSRASSENPTQALEELCQAYWFPIYTYLRRTGETKETAEDLTQDFFLQLLKRKDLATLDRRKGKFRSFLLASLKHYLSNNRAHHRTKKRGGNITHLSLDWSTADAKYQLADPTSLSPDAAFDREWAKTLLERVIHTLAAEFHQTGRSSDFAQLKKYLTTEKGEIPYEQAAAELGIKPTALRVAVHRLRKRYRKILLSDISATIPESEDPRLELNSLMESFS